MRAPSGLLIVNADDWGGESSATDAILGCVELGAVTSTTAMVHMADSERASGLARRHGIPAGLHLNLTLPFSDPGAPQAVRERQARVVELIGERPAHWPWRPGRPSLLARCVADQLAEFERLYGQAPTHLDGHNHVHLSPNVILAGRLPRDLPLRRAQNWPPPATPRARFVRAARSAMTARFTCTELFASIGAVHPLLGGRGLEELLDRSLSTSVEIMTHPQWPDELELLSSPEWVAALRGRPLGSFQELANAAPVGAGSRSRAA
jgi:chitin disaccharide deacetylase